MIRKETDARYHSECLFQISFFACRINCSSLWHDSTEPLFWQQPPKIKICRMIHLLCCNFFVDYPKLNSSRWVTAVWWATWGFSCALVDWRQMEHLKNVNNDFISSVFFCFNGVTGRAEGGRDSSSKQTWCISGWNHRHLVSFLNLSPYCSTESSCSNIPY